MAENRKRNAPSFQVLKDRVGNAKFQLRTIISEVSDVLRVEDERQIRDLIKKLKEAHKPYTKASKELSRWYLDNASPQESTETRDERLALHDEVDESVATLNSSLTSLGLDVESFLGNLSTVASQMDESEQFSSAQKSFNVTNSQAENLTQSRSQPVNTLVNQMNFLDIIRSNETVWCNTTTTLNDIPPLTTGCLGNTRSTPTSCLRFSTAPILSTGFHQFGNVANPTPYPQNNISLQTSNIPASIPHVPQSVYANTHPSNSFHSPSMNETARQFLKIDI